MPEAATILLGYCNTLKVDYVSVNWVFIKILLLCSFRAVSSPDYTG